MKLTLLAPSAAALRSMLRLCEDFASSRGLKFNSQKTQMILFGRVKSTHASDSFISCGSPLPFLDSVIHLGHVLRYDLSDEEDIIMRTRDMIRKANCMLHTFPGVDCAGLTRLFQSFCLSLYGSALWNLSCRGIRTIEVAFNNILRRIWKLPALTHTAILHCVAGLQSMYNTIYRRTMSLICAAANCPSRTVQEVYRDSAHSPVSFCGFNFLYGTYYVLKLFCNL